MECSCDCNIDTSDGDTCCFFRKSLVTARKKHKCTECKQIILPGTQYEYACGVWGGDLETYKTCPDCLSLIDEFFSGGYYYTMIWENFYEFVDEAEGGISEVCISNLTPIARGKVCEAIQNYWVDSEEDEEE